jgi:hypothetical protein
MNRLIYKSRCTKDIDWDFVKEISDKSYENNSLIDVSGVLLASRSHFLQVLEGRFEDVNTVFRRIVRDDRHAEMTLIAFTTIDARLFSEWGMRGIGTFNLNVKIEKELMNIYGEEEGGVRFPLEEWKALSLFQDIKMIGQLPDWKT